MKNILSAIVFACAAAAYAVPAQSVEFSTKVETHTRPKAQAEHKRTFTIERPVIRGVSPAVSRKIESALEFERVFDFTLKEEMDEIQWLEEAGYRTLNNDRGILSVQLWISGSGAYPSGAIKYLNFDIATGDLLKPADILTDLPRLAGVVRVKQQAAVKAAVEFIKSDPETADIDTDGLLKDKTFGIEDLDTFYIEPDGITFSYSYGFSHVIRALEPDNDYKLSWPEARPFIKPKGLLERFVR